MIKSWTDVNARDEFERNAPWTQPMSLGVCRYPIEQGIGINHRNIFGRRRFFNMHDLKIAKSIGDAGAELHAIGFEGRNALPPMISCLKFGNISSDKVSEFENKRTLHSIGCLHSAGAS